MHTSRSEMNLSKFNNISNRYCYYCGKYFECDRSWNRCHLAECGFNEFLKGNMEGFKSLALMLYNRKIEVKHVLQANEYLGEEEYIYGDIKKYNPELADKQKVIVISKMDLSIPEMEAEIRASFPQKLPLAKITFAWLVGIFLMSYPQRLASFNAVSLRLTSASSFIPEPPTYER